MNRIKFSLLALCVLALLVVCCGTDFEFSDTEDIDIVPENDNFVLIKENLKLLNYEEQFIFPVQTVKINSRYGLRQSFSDKLMSFHNGIDLEGSIGTPVIASMSGTVIVTDSNRHWGKFIIIDHGDYKSIYAHLSAILVKQYNNVSCGDKIAELGNTGFSTCPHLHFGIYNKDGKPVNPLSMINLKGAKHE
jgi:murein DD-endopeptidase MepM/ murein hydrolase activator NlpD